MWIAVYVIAGIALAAGLFLALRTYLRFRGLCVVNCPETHESVAVQVDVWQAAGQAVFGQPHLRLNSCTHWPERRNCGQGCLPQIEAGPEGCLVRSILTQWYAGKSCVFCQRPFEAINWLEHRPALLNTESKTVEWFEVPPETLPAVLETHRPVCWNCHIAQRFRLEHPGLIVDRGATHPVAGA